MKLLINTSCVLVGGGIQVSKSFIEELLNIDSKEYHIVLSNNLKKELKLDRFPSNFYFYDGLEMSGNFINRIKVAILLNSLEKQIKPDVVFTIFGPSYWKPKAIHISGYADGWCYNKDSIAFSILSLKNRLLIKFRVKIKNFFLKNTTDYLIVETNAAKVNIVRELNFPGDRIFVVGNTCSKVFNEFEAIGRKKIYLHNDVKYFNLLTLCSFYPHKNLPILQEVSIELKRRNINNVVFYLTIESEIFSRFFKDDMSIVNLGPQLLEECPKLFMESDAMILPTLLETFSASYPEAMKMNVPILTSDLDFARDICKDAALYFNPLDPKDIADKIIQIMQNKTLRNHLIQNGRERLKIFETSTSRAEKYVHICNRVLN